MKILLAICPLWNPEHPPLSIALLSEALKKSGHKAVKFDLNRMLYVKCGEEYKNMWQYNPLECTEGHYKNLIDGNKKLIGALTKKILDSKADAVGFTVYNINKYISLEIARAVKKRNPGMIVVFGGPECTFEGEAIMKEGPVDHVVVGEGEKVLPDLLKRIENKDAVSDCKSIWYKEGDKVIYTGDRGCISDLDSLPYPDFSDAPELYDKKALSLPIQTSRSCVNHCAYCSIVPIWQSYRHMSAKRVFREIINGYKKTGATMFVFHCSLINGDMRVLGELCDIMIKYRLDTIIKSLKAGKTAGENRAFIWGGQARISPEMTPVVLNKMRKAGCAVLCYGIESGSQKVLDKMNKGYSIKDAKKVLKDTFEAGISCQINIIVGFPTETEDDFKKTLEFIKDVKKYISRIDVRLCVVQKGTSLYRYPEKFGISHKHEIFWESDKGRNNYKERDRRYKELCSLTDKIGMKLFFDLEKMKQNRVALLREYHDHESYRKRPV